MAYASYVYIYMNKSNDWSIIYIQVCALYDSNPYFQLVIMVHMDETVQRNVNVTEPSSKLMLVCRHATTSRVIVSAQFSGLVQLVVRMSTNVTW